VNWLAALALTLGIALAVAALIAAMAKASTRAATPPTAVHIRRNANAENAATDPERTGQ